MAFLGAPPLSGQVLGLWPDCCKDIYVLLVGHPYYRPSENKKKRAQVFYVFTVYMESMATTRSIILWKSLTDRYS